jgi:ribosomal protein L29
MKTKDFKNLREKGVKELKKMVYTKNVEAAKKAMEIKTGKEKNLKLVRHLRREIAKILTLVKEKEILEKIEAAAESDTALASQTKGGPSK